MPRASPAGADRPERVPDSHEPERPRRSGRAIGATGRHDRVRVQDQPSDERESREDVQEQQPVVERHGPGRRRAGCAGRRLAAARCGERARVLDPDVHVRVPAAPRCEEARAPSTPAGPATPRAARPRRSRCRRDVRRSRPGAGKRRCRRRGWDRRRQSRTALWPLTVPHTRAVPPLARLNTEAAAVSRRPRWVGLVLR